MDKQFIITVGCEAGSGGREISRRLAGRLSIPFYDRDLLRHIADEHDLSEEYVQRHDEKPRNILFTRTVKGYSNSPEENLAQLQFDFFRARAKEGQSFLVLGRCAGEILKEHPGLIRVFILADTAFKKARLMDVLGLTSDEALERMAKKDRRRKYFHSQYCESKWGDARNYDLVIKTSALGIDASLDLLHEYIKLRLSL